MEKKCALTIKAVDNGWIVIAFDPDGGEYAPITQTRVFQKIGELNAFIAEHFSSRPEMEREKGMT